MRKNNVIIDGVSYDLVPIGELDITNDWVVIEPLTFKTSARTLEKLVVQAKGGFGCKGAALSLHGGKIFNDNYKGENSEYIYRSEIAGLATKEMLDALGIKQSPEPVGDLWL